MAQGVWTLPAFMLLPKPCSTMKAGRFSLKPTSSGTRMTPTSVSPSYLKVMRCSAIFASFPHIGQRGLNRAAFGRSGISACVIGHFVRYWQSDAGRTNVPVDRWRNSLRLATFKHQGRVSYGAVTPGGIVDLGRKLAKYPSLL